MGLNGYWGKAEGGDYHPLTKHALDVAAVGDALLARDRLFVDRLARVSGVSADSLCRSIPFLLALHDLGKFSEGFQDLRQDLRERLAGVRRPVAYLQHHGTLGYRLWLSFGPSIESGEMLRVRAADADLDGTDSFELTLPWVAAVTGHHGQPPEGGPVGGAFSRSAKDDAWSFVCEVARLLGACRLDVNVDGDYAELSRRFRISSWLLAGLAVLSDWIGSNRGFFPFDGTTGLEEYWELARSRAQLALSEVGVLSPAVRPQVGMGPVFPGIVEPTPLQHLAEEVEVSAGPQLFVVEDVTGSGKTEAALVLAHRLMVSGAADGVFVALPTMATANGMYGRVAGVQQRVFASRAPVILAHSARHLVDIPLLTGAGDAGSGDDTAAADASAWLLDNRKKSLLAPLGIGTIDQALLAIIAARHNSLRLLGLHRHVLVVDEVHAYDPYMLELLGELLALQAALGGSAVLLSATLPLSTRERLTERFREGLGATGEAPRSAAYPLLTRVDARGLAEIPGACPTRLHRAIPVSCLNSENDAIAVLTRVAEEGRCGVWIRNSVADAIHAYELLRDRLGAHRVTLFHARFLLGDRLAIEGRALANFGAESGPAERAGRILVATQVVEQSLDLDFDEMVTDLAPIDLLIQRAGRLHRHRRDATGARTDGSDSRPRPVLHLLAPIYTDAPEARWLADALPRTARVYPDHPVLWRTLRLLDRTGAIETPERSRELVEAVYGQEALLDFPPGLEKTAIEAGGAAAASQSFAALGAVRWELGYERTGPWLSDEVAPTRLGDPSGTIRLGALDGGRLVPLARASRMAWEFSQVSVRKSLLDRPLEGADTDAEEAVKRSMADGGRYCRVIPMRRSGREWEGRGVSGAGKEVVVRYSRETGLTVSRG